MKSQMHRTLPTPFNKDGCFVYSILWIAWFHCARIMYQEKRGPIPEFTDRMLEHFTEYVRRTSLDIIGRDFTVMRHAELLRLALEYVAERFELVRSFEVMYAKMSEPHGKAIRGISPIASVIEWARDADGDGDFDFTHFTAEYGQSECNKFNPLPGSFTVERGVIVSYRGFWIFAT